MPERTLEWREGMTPFSADLGAGSTSETINGGSGGPRMGRMDMVLAETAAAELAVATLPAQEASEESADIAPIDRQTAEWAMWGGAPDRNMVSATTGITLDFDLEEKRVLWTSQLGSQTYGNPIFANGKVLVGTNNGASYRPQYPAAKDMGILLCFDAADGKFLWQLSREKMPSGRVNDWPLQGICSAPVVEGNRLWLVTNRCEVMCLDLNGFHDGSNDGDTSEVDTEVQDADIVWTVDMYNDLAVFPHNLATSSPVMHGDVLYLITSNGVDEAHLENPSPRAPSFLGLNKHTGEVVFEDNSPGDTILHGQWSSPCIGVVDGKAQVIFAGGDGWVYSFSTDNHELLWKCDLNPKDTVWELGGAGTRNNIIGTPVFYENSVIVAVGQDPEHGEGVGHLWRIDATKTGDLSAEIGEIGVPGEPNPNSGIIWHYGGVDEEQEPIFRRTISTVAVHDGLVFAPDLSGFVHCVDLATGQRYWQHDLMAAIWGSPLYVDGKIFIGDEDGRLSIFDASKEYALKRQELEKEVAAKRKAMKESQDDDEIRRLRGEIRELIASVAPEVRESPAASSIYTTPTIAAGVMYISDRSKLYAIQITKQ
jgi:outer membrane protein assembly factor BamB